MVSPSVPEYHLGLIHSLEMNVETLREVAPIRPREERIAVARAAPGLEQAPENLLELGHYRHCPSPAAVRRPAPLDRVDAPHHAERLPLEADVADAQRQELVEAQACEGRGQKDRAVLIGGGLQASARTSVGQ